VHLANPAAIQQYKGLKFADDRHDAFWLGHMLSLGILPEGYICPEEERPIRDLLRKRSYLVKQRTSHIIIKFVRIKGLSIFKKIHHTKKKEYPFLLQQVWLFL
jgi:hypothetical protein